MPSSRILEENIVPRSRDALFDETKLKDQVRNTFIYLERYEEGALSWEKDSKNQTMKQKEEKTTQSFLKQNKWKTFMEVWYMWTLWSTN